MNLTTEHTLQSLLDLYFTYRLLRPATLNCYRDSIISLEKSLSVSEKRKLLKDIGVAELLKWRADVLQTCTGTSFNMHRRHVRALLNFAVTEGLLEVSPLSKVSAAPTGKKKPKTVPVTWLRKTRALLDDNHPRLQPAWFWRAVVDVMYFGMMRRRQVIELKWKNIHFRNNSITLAAEGSKSRKEWCIPLPTQVMQQLLELKAKTKKILLREVRPSDQVFCLPLFSENSQRYVHKAMNEAHLSAFYNRLSKILGYTISSHRVRHTSATIMLSRSTDLKGTSEMLGHSSITLTADTYIHPSLSALRKSQKKMLFYGEN